MTRLEQDLRKYLDTREAEIEAAIDRYGVVGGTCGHDPRDMLADLRAIMDGQPLPARGAE